MCVCARVSEREGERERERERERENTRGTFFQRNINLFTFGIPHSTDHNAHYLENSKSPCIKVCPAVGELCPVCAKMDLEADGWPATQMVLLQQALCTKVVIN